MSMPIQQVYLIQHGETDWSLSGQHTGITDIAFTENGRRVAKLLEPNPGSQDVSGDIRVDLGSSTPCWNDEMRDLPALTEVHQCCIFKARRKSTKQRRFSSEADVTRAS